MRPRAVYSIERLFIVYEDLVNVLLVPFDQIQYILKYALKMRRRERVISTPYTKPILPGRPGFKASRWLIQTLEIIEDVCLICWSDRWDALNRVFRQRYD